MDWPWSKVFATHFFRSKLNPHPLVNVTFIKKTKLLTPKYPCKCPPYQTCSGSAMVRCSVRWSSWQMQVRHRQLHWSQHPWWEKPNFIAMTKILNKSRDLDHITDKIFMKIAKRWNLDNSLIMYLSPGFIYNLTPLTVQSWLAPVWKIFIWDQLFTRNYSASVIFWWEERQNSYQNFCFGVMKLAWKIWASPEQKKKVKIMWF